VIHVIVITGASSGCGALTARALADAGHNVCAGMRDLTAMGLEPIAVKGGSHCFLADPYSRLGHAAPK
jgi:NADP-dependent 3-hydroxy acid dehydrogenase YdfG